MLFKDYTSVPSWQACRDRHITVLASTIVLTSILDRDLYVGLTVMVLNPIQGPKSL
jgi:hypothetical protein